MRGELILGPLAGEQAGELLARLAEFLRGLQVPVGLVQGVFFERHERTLGCRNGEYRVIDIHTCNF